jgi:hypothetical protein
MAFLVEELIILIAIPSVSQKRSTMTRPSSTFLAASIALSSKFSRMM